VTLDIVLVLGILAIAVILFVTEWVRIDAVALMVLAALALTGVLDPTEAVAGFSSPAVITVWAVFILGGGLSRTGVAGFMGRQMLRFAGSSESRLIMSVMVPSAALSAFMSNVGVAALMLPVVMDIARRTGRTPSRLLIPLAFSVLLGGMLTLVGTPPNLLVSASLEAHGLAGFELFDFTPVAAVVAIVGIGYMSLIGRRLLPTRGPAPGSPGQESDLPGLYRLGERLFALDVDERSPLVGTSLADSRLESGRGLLVMAVQRGGKLQLAPNPRFVFRAGDRIIVQGQQVVAEGLGAFQYLTIEPDPVPLEELVSADVGFAEVRVAAGSELIGKTLEDVDFRHRFHGCLVLAVWRDGVPLRTHVSKVALESGDVLLMHGHRGELERCREDVDFHVSTIFDPFVYGLEERLISCVVPRGSPLVGKTLVESRLGDVFGLGVMGIVRGDEKKLIPGPDERLEAGDRLLVKGKPEDLVSARGVHALSRADWTPSLQDLESEDVTVAEAVLAPRSSAGGKTLRELNFREKYGLNVVSVMRGGQILDNLRYLSLRFGDALLLQGPRARLRLLGSEPDFLVLTQSAQQPTRAGKAPLAALLMVAVIGSAISGAVPLHIAAVSGAVLMVFTGCLSMDEAYGFIEWRVVFLIAGMLPLGTALQESGAIDLAAAGVVTVAGDARPLAIVALIYALTVVCALVMPTPAVAILMAPMAIGVAGDLALSPYALLMTVALAVSASFMSLVAHPANMLIMGPGGYRFVDYVKVGLPLTVVCLVVLLLILPVVWPLGL
jgi:di/tricarboxylate transporter